MREMPMDMSEIVHEPETEKSSAQLVWEKEKAKLLLRFPELALAPKFCEEFNDEEKWQEITPEVLAAGRGGAGFIVKEQRISLGLDENDTISMERILAFTLTPETRRFVETMQRLRQESDPDIFDYLVDASGGKYTDELGTILMSDISRRSNNNSRVLDHDGELVDWIRPLYRKYQGHPEASSALAYQNAKEGILLPEVEESIRLI